jgi:uncharacterized protein (TIGR03382 family)
MTATLKIILTVWGFMPLIALLVGAWLGGRRRSQ